MGGPPEIECNFPQSEHSYIGGSPPPLGDQESDSLAGRTQEQSYEVPKASHSMASVVVVGGATYTCGGRVVDVTRHGFRSGIFTLLGLGSNFRRRVSRASRESLSRRT